MDKSVGNSCSETATQNEEPVMRLATNLNNIQLEDDKNTTPTIPIKDSGAMQGKVSNTIDEDDDITSSTPMQPPTTPSKNSLPLKTSSYNPVDTSIETTYSKTTGLEDDANRIDRRTAGGSAIMSGEDSNSLQIGTEYPQYHKFNPRVVNLTDIEFNEAERALLNKYLKFIIEPKFNRNLAVELLSDATLAGEDLQPNEMWQAQLDLWNVIKNELANKKNSMINQKFLAYKSTIESINKKLEENAVARKADEDDFIVIINKEKYLKKMEAYFLENSIKEIKDITEDFQKEITTYLDSDFSFLNKDDKDESRLPSPIAPELITLIKVDKDKKDFSIRPFINTENSPAYKLAMKIDKLIRDNYVFSKKYSVSSSMDLIREIKDKPITNSSQLVSLGIKNLYANVPVGETIAIVAENLTTYRKCSQDTIGKIVDFLKIVAKYNYFQFNKITYQQDNALTFGSCLSDTMAEIFINNLEQTILEDGNLKEIVYYGRIVDKILLVVNGTDFDINKFCLAFFYKPGEKKIDFSVEREINNCIQFLDLNIIRLQNQLTFNVFRKSTATDVVIPSDSCHPQKDKEGAFRSLLDRAYKMPMSEEDRLYELNIIKQIAHSNGYEMDMVDRLWVDVRRNNEAEQINVEKKTVTAPYYGNMSEKLVNIFKPYNVKFDFQAKNLVEHYLRLDLGYRNRLLEKPGVYKLSCKEDQCTYIGETGRSFLVRFKEHKEQNDRIVIQHISVTGHHMTAYILHIEKNYKRRELLEKFQITIHNVKDDCKLLNTKIQNKIKFFDGFDELFKNYYKSKTLSHPTN